MKVDIGIFYRYATDNKYNEDIFFSEKINSETKVGETIQEIFHLKGEKKTDSIQDTFSKLLEDKDFFIQQIEKNNEYMRYLDSRELTLEDLITYMNLIADLNSKIMDGSFYLSALIIFLLMYLLSGFRIELYLIAGVLYIFTNLSTFTSGIFANIFFYPMHWISHLMGQDYTFEEYAMYIEFLPTIKEAFLSFIIFDTVVLAWRESWKKRKSKKITKIYYSIDEIINVLNKLEVSNGQPPHIRVSKIKVDFYYLYKFTRKKKKDSALREVKRLTVMLLYKDKSNSILTTEALNFLLRLKQELSNSTIFKEEIDQHYKFDMEKTKQNIF
ncbi:hypothetical protein ABEW19_29665 [Paenibacillus illinoisensis]|uniref:hypothetical protein n=1 Tax=Paenibacillus illinoisensis TaxID=59845 RepID=UPI003D2C2D04